MELMERGEKMEKIDVYLPPELASRIKQEADCQLISSSAVVRKIVASYYGYSGKRAPSSTVESTREEPSAVGEKEQSFSVENPNVKNEAWAVFQTEGEGAL